MKVLIVGNGGREHALAWRIAQSPKIDKIYCAPGNAGTAQVGTNVDVDPCDLDAVAGTCNELAPDLVVVGPEAPLCAGLVDRLTDEGIKVFGPTAAAARLEGDKAFAKLLMKTAKVPTAEARIFRDFEAAHSYVATRDTGVVVKAAGLAAGKGVSVCPDPADALLALEEIMVNRAFGDAGDVVIVEELLKGQEVSVLALVDDRTIYMLETAQDHKAIGDGDRGPNTGGMGAYSPAPIATPDIMATVEKRIIVPIVDAMRQQGTPYRGVLYAGLMITPAGPKVLEFNCRFGDPETQAVLARLDADLFEILEACADGRLAETEIRWHDDAAVCVVMASGGYPGSYEKGKAITGVQDAAALDGVTVFQAGTRDIQGRLLTAGGRVLGVTALGSNVGEARERAYQATSLIRFEGAYYRHDIATRAL